jgi:hypothetical protein
MDAFAFARHLFFLNCKQPQMFPGGVAVGHPGDVIGYGACMIDIGLQHELRWQQNVMQVMVLVTL